MDAQTVKLVIKSNSVNIRPDMNQSNCEILEIF